jgi:hypothetical protein
MMIRMARHLLWSINDVRTKAGSLQCTHRTAIETSRASVSKVTWKALAQKEEEYLLK